MIKRLHHIGIAVPGLDAGARAWGEGGLGLPLEGQEDVTPAQTRVAMFPIGQTRIELLEPMGPGTPVAKFLDKRGPGIHHLCFEVDDIRAEMARLRGLGLRLTTEEPTPGAHGALVAWIHPGDTGGVLIELNELPGGHP
jgi:methylmalonyl-CoA/ethylmalonyl-CoA epimerase